MNLGGDKGEVTVGTSIAMTYLVGMPAVVTATGDGIIWVAAVVLALTAIGVGAAKFFRWLRKAFRGIDRIEELVNTADRMEIRQLAMEEQLKQLIGGTENGTN